MVNLHQIIEDYDDIVDDILSANYQTFPGRLKKYTAFIDDCAPIKDVLLNELPVVDFDSWYSTAQETAGGMVGSGTLNWPANNMESIAMHVALIRHISKDFNLLLNFCVDFLYSENHFDIMVSDFNNQIVELTSRDIKKIFARANPITIKLPNIQNDIIDIKPNFFGIGINFNEAWRRFRDKFSKKA